jgi:hypothetical protein
MIHVQYSPGAGKTAVALLGQLVPDEQMAALAGALDGATVQIAAHNDSLFSDVQHPDVVFQQRRLARDELGRMYVRNLYLEKQPWGQPLLGLRALLRQIEAGQALGIAYLITFATGSAYDDGFNGYYTWARYGFDAELPPDRQQLLSPALSGCRTLNDMMLRDGAAWWRAEGVPLEMSFDLRPDSSMMRVLQRYLDDLRKAGRWS